MRPTRDGATALATVIAQATASVETATFDFDGEVVVIDDGITAHGVAMDQIVSWEKPMNVSESDVQQVDGPRAIVEFSTESWPSDGDGSK